MPPSRATSSAGLTDIEPDQRYAGFDRDQTEYDRGYSDAERCAGRRVPGACGGVRCRRCWRPSTTRCVLRLSGASTTPSAPLQCGALYDGINKSTATHHFKILREAGVTERLVIDGLTYQKLRLDEVESALPGLLASVVGGANRDAALQ